MTFQPGANLYPIAFGNRPESVEVPHYDVRDPNSTDILYPLNKAWLNTAAQKEWVLLSLSSGPSGTTANWQLTTGASGTLSTLTGDSGGAIGGDNAGNINLLGTANQITTAGSGHTITFSLIGPYTPATYTAHGVLIGEGTSSIVATTPGTDGQVLTGNTGTDPAFAAIGTKSGLTAHGVLLAEGASAFSVTAVGTTGTVLSGNTGADPTFQSLSELNVVDNTTGTVASPTTMVVGTTYIADQASATTGFILPSTATLGSVIYVVGNGPGGWQIQQNANQSIKSSSQTTTTGTSGSLSSTNRYNAVKLTCVIAGASTVWSVTSASGTLTFV